MTEKPAYSLPAYSPGAFCLFEAGFHVIQGSVGLVT